ncbi:sialin [Nematostella vectensis]|uniref:sialin n=1 Tax=Nematostella vectensis TaxID=45351 RepID=UPI0020775CBD|nr:sialin [Nematostella vectensis]
MAKDHKQTSALQNLSNIPYDDQLFNASHRSAKPLSPSDQSCCDGKGFHMHPKRYLVAVLALLGFANVYGMRVNLSVALVAMVSNHTRLRDGKWVDEMPDFEWDSKLQGIVLGSFFYGYIVTQLPGGLLAKRFGGRNLFGIGIFCTAVFTLLTPVAAHAHVGALIALRVLEGLCEGVVFPANHAIWSKWAPPLERSKLTTIAVSGAHIGTVLAMPLSGFLAQRFGWSTIFYVFGVFGIIWTLLWFSIVKNSPSEDPRITAKELNYILSTLGRDAADTRDLKIPWKAIFTSVPVWAIVVAHFSENWGFYTMLTELPSYLKHRLQFDITHAGFISALPYLIMSIFVQLGGHLADCLRRKQILTTTAVRKTFNTVGFVTQAICLVAAGYTTDWMTAVACLTVAVGVGGLAFSGFFVNHLDIAPQFAGILLGISNTVATIPGIFSPLLTGYIVQTQAAVEWRIVFYIGGAIYAAGAVFYAVFASGEKQTWADDQEFYEEILMSHEAEEEDDGE